MQLITKNYNVFKYHELTERAQERAIDKLYDINVEFGDWWDCTYEDAKTIGFAINEFDIDRGSSVEGDLTLSITDTIKLILENHGESTNTYQLAKNYQEQITDLGRAYKTRGINDQALADYENAMEQLQIDFERALCEEYLTLLTHEYEYLTSKEGIIETIELNDYTFLEDGTLFNE